MAKPLSFLVLMCLFAGHAAAQPLPIVAAENFYGDIARQVEHIGRKWEADDMKRLLIDEFADEMRAAGTPLHHDGRIVPSFDGRRIVQLGIQSRDFYVKEAAAFIEFLYAFGAARDVRWSEP